MKKLERVVVVGIHLKFIQPFSCINFPMNVWHWITAISEGPLYQQRSPLVSKKPPVSAKKSARIKETRGCNRQANATLHRVVVVRLRWHEQTKAYAARRMEEGRSKPEIMRWLKRFIAREVFHTLLGRPPVRTSAT